jgi:hypothetical protein
VPFHFVHIVKPRLEQSIRLAALVGASLGLAIAAGDVAGAAGARSERSEARAAGEPVMAIVSLRRRRSFPCLLQHSSIRACCSGFPARDESNDSNFEHWCPGKPQLHQHLCVMCSDVIWIAPPACGTRWSSALGHCSSPQRCHAAPASYARGGIGRSPKSDDRPPKCGSVVTPFSGQASI